MKDPDNFKKSSQPIDVAPLAAMFNRIHPLSPGVIDFLASHCLEMKACKKTVLLNAGEVCDYIYFVNKGLIRGYVIDGGKELTTWISSDNELVTSISGLMQNGPSRENIQAIEDCNLLALSYNDLEKLYQRHPDFNIVIRKLLQLYYLDAENRALIVRMQSAEKRYKYFLEKHRALVNRAPLKFIASFLGLTVETLSRIRNRLSRNGH